MVSYIKGGTQAKDIRKQDPEANIGPKRDANIGPKRDANEEGSTMRNFHLLGLIRMGSDLIRDLFISSITISTSK